MPLPTITTPLVAKFRDIILANELDNNITLALKFSDPDGRQGRSGWSFGICQFDLAHNSRASLCLKACGFTEQEIAGLANQTVKDLAPLEAKLRENRAVVEAFDLAQLKGCLEKAVRICGQFKLDLADETALMALADYDNQYYLSALDQPGTLVHYLVAQRRAATAEDILTFKLDHTKYGREHPKDCRRRHTNIIKVMRKEQQ